MRVPTSIAARGGGGSFKRLKIYNSEEQVPIEFVRVTCFNNAHSEELFSTCADRRTPKKKMCLSLLASQSQKHASWFFSVAGHSSSQATQSAKTYVAGKPLILPL